MAHISSISAGMFSDLSVCVDLDQNTLAIVNPTQITLKACFANEIANGTAPGVDTGEFIRIKNVREFPSMGTPPNIVNVPVYGSKTSQQIQGQADAPSMELTLNYIGTDWQDTANYLGSLVGDNVQRVFRFTLMNDKPTTHASTTAGLGTVANSQYFWYGKIEAFQVNPQLTDANTATVTITVQSEFFGAYTD